MTLTPKEIKKYSKIQKQTAEWVAERTVYICKLQSAEMFELSKIIQNQKEVFEKEHKEHSCLLRFEMTMFEFADKLRKVKMSDFDYKENSGEVTTYRICVEKYHILGHIFSAYNSGFNTVTGWEKINDPFCKNIAESFINYFKGFNIDLVINYDWESHSHQIDVRTNGLVPSDFF